MRKKLIFATNVRNCEEDLEDSQQCMAKRAWEHKRQMTAALEQRGRRWRMEARASRARSSQRGGVDRSKKRPVTDEDQ